MKQSKLSFCSKRRDDACIGLGGLSQIGMMQGRVAAQHFALALGAHAPHRHDVAVVGQLQGLVGMLPGWGGSVRLARAIGLRRAKELALSGRWLGAPEALQWGLVNHMCAAEELLPKAQMMASDMLRGAPGILVSYKSLLDQGHVAGLSDALKLERQASMENNLAVTRDQIDERLADMRRRAPRSPPD